MGWCACENKEEIGKYMMVARGMEGMEDVQWMGAAEVRSLSGGSVEKRAFV